LRATEHSVGPWPALRAARSRSSSSTHRSGSLLFGREPAPLPRPFALRRTSPGSASLATHVSPKLATAAQRAIARLAPSGGFNEASSFAVG
jgi:hypothetical protein